MLRRALFQALAEKSQRPSTPNADVGRLARPILHDELSLLELGAPPVSAPTSRGGVLTKYGREGTFSIVEGAWIQRLFGETRNPGNSYRNACLLQHHIGSVVFARLRWLSEPACLSSFRLPALACALLW